MQRYLIFLVKTCVGHVIQNLVLLGWPDAFYMNTGDNSTTNGDIAKGKEIGAGVGERSSIFNSDVTTAEDESSSIQSQASITATITSDTTTPKGILALNLLLKLQ